MGTLVCMLGAQVGPDFRGSHMVNAGTPWWILWLADTRRDGLGNVDSDLTVIARIHLSISKKWEIRVCVCFLRINEIYLGLLSVFTCNIH